VKKDLQSGCILILGAPNDINGNLSLIAKTRLKQGFKELSLNQGFKILLTGGFGKHFNETSNTHWSYAKAFLIKEFSIAGDSFLSESIESSNSVEDIEKAEPIFQKYDFKKIIIVTSEFHLERVKYITEKALGFNGGKLFYSCAEDAELDESMLKGLREHEEEALKYLQSNYRLDIM